MAESERRQRVVSSTPRLTSEDIANRKFGKAVRGVSETEVRSFLRRVAEELTHAHDRENELANAIDALEEQLRAPRPLDEQELLDTLGEETARLLRSAREAAEDIRKHSEERAALLVDEAETEAQRLRADAAEVLATRTQEAEARAAEMIAGAEERARATLDGLERDAEEQRLRAQSEVDALVEGARQQGRLMLEEAKATRERVLADLIRRRGLLQAQVDELRNGRDHLLDAYRTVKRTFLEATEALSQVEARAAAGRPIPSVDPEDVDAIIAAERVVLAGTDPEHPVALAEVDTLFARIRAGHGEAGTAGADASDAADAADGERAGAPGATTAAGATPAAGPPAGSDDGVQHDDGGQDDIDLREDALPADVLPPAPASALDAWRAGRARTVDPLMPSLMKRAKRAAQDDQNALLDAVRRHKGRPNASQVLGNDDAVRAAWEMVLRDAVDAAYSGGRVAAGSDASAMPDDAAADAVAAVVGPLRGRLAVAIDSGEEGDTGGLVERIGARYREWKNQSLEAGLRDALAGAWTRGVFDATSDGEVLHWIPLVEGRCSDCDDNALEPTVKGVAFPTGQLRPPAHPGCRCLLAPATILAGLPTHA